ncbi:hypothetical protein [Mesorhizobium sp. M0684]|uniref:hypothetical protein n=1 Tax=Mesorhizobium sp. M0684 TaxID=2956986 RepID=UPI00333C3C13
MKTLPLLAGLALTLACALTDARAQDVSRTPGENDLAFAKRVVGFADNADPHTTAVSWNASRHSSSITRPPRTIRNARSLRCNG